MPIKTIRLGDYTPPADHGHDMADVFSDFGPPKNLPSGRVAIAETFPRQFVNATSAPASTIWLATGIYLPKDLLVTGITYFSAGTSLNTGVHQWFGLWDRDLGFLRASLDGTSGAWASNTMKRMALDTPFTTTYAGRHYVGLCIEATTVPTIAGLGGVGGALRSATPNVLILDNSSPDTAPPNPLVNAAASAGTSLTPYAVLD